MHFGILTIQSENSEQVPGPFNSDGTEGQLTVDSVICGTSSADRWGAGESSSQ